MKFTAFSARTVVLVCVLAVYGFSSLWAQKGPRPAPVLIQGKVSDEKTGETAIMKYRITVPESEKVYSGKSKADGTFQQTLPSGATYTITFSDYNVVKKSETFTLKPSKDFYEQNVDFKVQLLKKGNQLLATNLFTPNSDVVSSAGENELKTFAAFLTENRSLDVVMTVYADGTFKQPKPAKTAKQTKTKDKAKSKKKEAEKPAEPAVPDNTLQLQYTDLVQKRITALKEYFAKNYSALVSRITFTPVDTAPATPNVVVTVGEVKNKFE